MIASNIVPNKIITSSNKDVLWMTSEVNRMILEKAKPRFILKNLYS